MEKILMDPILKLLIIDDNQDTLVAMEAYFTKRNYSVTAIDNGLEALKLIESQSQKFDIMITDIVMPDVSGVAIISVAKRLTPNMPVIAITGWGEHPQVLASEAKADTVIKKPIELMKLERKIISLVLRR
jgi:DNA-binding response OmpR family regulator